MVNGDVTTAAAVLQCTEPYQANEIGDKVKVMDVWDFSKREAVMKTSIDVKFSTGSALAKELLDTGKKIIVESGRDNYYACGLSFTNKNILDRKSYTGKNKGIPKSTWFLPLTAITSALLNLPAYIASEFNQKKPRHRTDCVQLT